MAGKLEGVLGRRQTFLWRREPGFQNAVAWYLSQCQMPGPRSQVCFLVCKMGVPTMGEPQDLRMFRILLLSDSSLAMP